MDQNNSLEQKGTAAVWVAVVILVALISGGGVWWWQTNKAASEKTALQSQITSLQSQLSQKTTPTTATTTPATTTTTKDETADWKTYSNTTYNYSIKYPSDWSVLTRGDYQVHFLAPTTAKFNPDKEPGQGNIYIVMQKSGPSLSPIQYSSKKTISISGTSATRYEGVPGGQEPASKLTSTEIVIEKNNSQLEIVHGTNDSYGSIFELMLSTFQFTK